MRFKIWRASNYTGKDSSPCKGAVFEDGKWFVEVPDLDALLALAKNIGHDLILDHEEPELAIYDDYME